MAAASTGSPAYDRTAPFLLTPAWEPEPEPEPEPELEPEPQPEVPIVQVEEEPTGPKRPPGKLYGRSLIDDLDARKAAMRGKQR